MTVDVAIVGGGPAGLAASLALRRQGLSVAVFDRQRWPIDKACGEGLMPAGLAALERLGVMPFLDRTDTAPFDRIKWAQENGATAIAALPAPGGLGVRRTALSKAMADAARAAGVELRGGVGVRAHRVEKGRVVLETDSGGIEARLLVAADGLNSVIRRTLGAQESPPEVPRRFGLRRHFALAPWDTCVEVHFARGVEAYVTPAGHRRVGVAFLWSEGLLPGEAPSFEGLLERFTSLKQRVAGAPFDSETRGAGPLWQPVHHRTSERVVLLGDAAGYVDAITGEGLTLAFEAAEVLGAVAVEALELGATAASWQRYEAACDALFGRYARLASGLVWATRHPLVRRLVIDVLAAAPTLFGVALRRALPRPHATLEIA